jgi:nucleoside-diphosphate-sugar epimerase
MTVASSAERVGVSRTTIQHVERGAPTVATQPTQRHTTRVEGVTTLVTGAVTRLGQRVITDLRAGGVDVVELDGAADEALPSGTDRLVLLDGGDHDVLAASRASAVRATQAALDRAGAAGVTHVVVVSSAMVYGAWPNNPVPLTEDAALRPDLQFGFAHQLAHIEQLVDDWRTASPGRSATVLRPVLTLAADGTGSIVRALAANVGTRLDEEDPPSQYLHLDDLASAVGLAHQQRLDGVFNVAPDGWIAGDRLRSLAGTPPRVRLPSWLVEPISDLRWRFQRGPIPPGLRSYARHGWLVANDRLVAAGWRPTVTNEQAYVEGTEAKWWTMLTPKRKQELSLGGMVAVGLAAAIAALVAIRRALAKRR